MKIAYVAGKYTGSSTYEVRNNIRKAEEVNEYCWTHDIVAVCPHTNTQFLDGLCDYEIWARGYLELLKRYGFDMMILVPGWETSKGTLAEIELARKIRLPIYTWHKGLFGAVDLEEFEQ